VSRKFLYLQFTLSCRCSIFLPSKLNSIFAVRFSILVVAFVYLNCTTLYDKCSVASRYWAPISYHERKSKLGYLGLCPALAALALSCLTSNIIYVLLDHPLSWQLTIKMIRWVHFSHVLAYMFQTHVIPDVPQACTFLDKYMDRSQDLARRLPFYPSQPNRVGGAWG
jgi:hypothetical protein